MLSKDLEKAIKEGKMFFMRKYKSYGEWGTPKLVSAEVAEHKSKVFVDHHCPYSFELAE